MFLDVEKRSAQSVDVTVLCRAYVDLVVNVSERELRLLGLNPGDDVRAETANIDELVRTWFPRARVLPGGNGANSAAGVAALGGRAAFVGKTGDDALGAKFREDFARRGVQFDALSHASRGTATCIVFITPDGERSMTYDVGVADNVALADIERSRSALETTQVLFLGLLYSHAPTSSAIVEQARSYARDAMIATTLHGYDRTFGSGERLLDADILLGNEREYLELLSELGSETVAQLARAHPDKIFACTKGMRGADVFSGAERYEVPAAAVEHVTDTTGAGDAWAAGFLFGMARRAGVQWSARLASQCAALLLDETGGRPSRSWRHLAL